MTDEPTAAIASTETPATETPSPETHPASPVSETPTSETPSAGTQPGESPSEPASTTETEIVHPAVAASVSHHEPHAAAVHEHEPKTEPDAKPEYEEKPEPAPTAESAPPKKKPRKTAKTAPAATAESADVVAHDAPADVVATVAQTDEVPTDPDADTIAPEVVAPEPAPEPPKKRWYAVKVQSGREDTIKAAIERKVKIEGLEEFFGQIVIPVDEINEKKKVKIKNKKTGEYTTQERNVVKKVKKFHGYIFTEVEFNDQILYVFRETSGVGDFVGLSARRKAGATESPPPPPMTDSEVRSMLTGVPDPSIRRDGKPIKTVVRFDYEKGDKVRVSAGSFAGSEGEVSLITEPKDPTETPKVTVVVTLWGRPVPVVLDYWEVAKI